MAEEEKIGDQSQSKGPWSASWIRWLVIICLASCSAVCIRGLMRETQPAGLPRRSLIGLPAPPIHAEGWLQGPAPTAEDLRGKIVVLDVWAFWCGPCREAASYMQQLYRRYHPRGVIFLGLTAEDSRTLAQSKRFVLETGMVWPQGYGAAATIEQLDVQWIPQMFVIDRQGVIAWDESSHEKIEDVVDRLLAPER